MRRRKWWQSNPERAFNAAFGPTDGRIPPHGARRRDSADFRRHAAAAAGGAGAGAARRKRPDQRRGPRLAEQGLQRFPRQRRRPAARALPAPALEGRRAAACVPGLLAAQGLEAGRARALAVAALGAARRRWCAASPPASGCAGATCSRRRRMPASSRPPCSMRSARASASRAPPCSCTTSRTTGSTPEIAGVAVRYSLALLATLCASWS